MNLMRKIVGHTRGGGETMQPPQDATLGLRHLCKMFEEFRHSPSGVSQKQLEDKLYNMLPLFCKVFGAAPSSDMIEKFGDILHFCSHVSRLMVSEIRRRASNQSTAAASGAIVKFLEINWTEESSNGWMLLSTINLLCSSHSSLVDYMTAAALPSTLVKCLYLFFDLPDIQLTPDTPQPGCEFTPEERRVLLQKVFAQILVRLCSHVPPAEELADKDDLTLLFSAITSWCPPHNVPWRKSAAEVLMTLSRHGLSTKVVQYIHRKGCMLMCINNLHRFVDVAPVHHIDDKGCMALCVDNMRRVQELSPIELVEMFVTVFCFLKDSSDVSQLLLDDFRSYQGYNFLAEFLLKMEQDRSEEAIQALRNLLLLVGSLTTCGYVELRPSTASAGSLFQMPGFTIPQPVGKGVSVRNLHAFQVLQTVFLKANYPQLCSTILDVISSIYHQDNANYFIVEPQNTLSQFAEKIHTKSVAVRVKFFEMMEFIVFNLNFVPCKELISLSILMKAHHSPECSLLCMKTLLNILSYNAIYKDAFREVGLLEVMVTCLHRYAALLKAQQDGTGGEIAETDKEMGFLVMEGLAQILSSNNSNAGVFRECGGARCVHNMVPYAACRQQALNIVQQLVLSSGGDDDLATLLGLMHTAPSTAVELNTHILKSLLNVLRESHRTRMAFRKVGGFVYVMSVLVSMEGCLADPPKAPWHQASRKEVVTLLKTVFSTLTVAMRYEPANARLFANEVRYSSLTEAVRLLGCFSTTTDIEPAGGVTADREGADFADYFVTLDEARLKMKLPRALLSACLMLRYLYDMALDSLDIPLQSQTSTTSDSPRHMKRISSVLESSSDHDSVVFIGHQKRASTGSLVHLLTQCQQEMLIVHPGALTSFLHLIPAISHASQLQLALELQLQSCECLKSLVRSERNQQVMCDAGLPHELLMHCNAALADESHPLHPPLQYIFERLAAQSLTPKDLRNFLRLGAPLCCASEDEDTFDARHSSDPTGPTYAFEKPQVLSEGKKGATNGGTVPLTRVKCLVSMTTPRDVRLHGASITPAFVEFDMNAEGFGCLYLPSIAPQGPPTPSVVGSGMMGGSDPGVVGGIGSGERLFPPQSGLTFSTWICVDKFSSSVCDPHPVRLLTLVRNIQGRDDSFICLSVFFAARDRALFVSTQETQMPAAGGADLHQAPILNDTTVRFWCGELTQEGQWRHVCLIFHKAGMLKNSSVSLFVDGVHTSTQKLHYISPNLGGTGTASPNAATSVFAYVGTPPQLRRASKLIWRQGPFHLVEDIIASSAVSALYGLGPNYIGSFQAPLSDSAEPGAAILPEEKIMFSVHAHAMSLMTIAKIRKVYTTTDAKSIAKQLAMSPRENATPIRILHNSAAHLSGSARSFGAILMGYLGVRTFCPKPVAKIILNVGGTSTLLGLIAMATDVEGLYAAVKALVCVVHSNKAALREMERTKGYQMLAMLFRKKKHLLNSHILHLTFSLVGTVDSSRETTVIPNKKAFEDLLCDLEVWHDAPSDLQRSLYEHFYELLTESSDQRNNLRLMQELGLVSKLLRIIRDPGLSKLSLQTIANVLTVLLSGITHTPSLLRFGQFMVSLLPNPAVNEVAMSLDDSCVSGSGDMSDVCAVSTSYNIQLRNLCLGIVWQLLTAQPSNNDINQHTCDEVLRILGFDWLLLFLQGHLHRSTVVLAMRTLLLMLGSPSVLAKFREGSTCGGWLDETQSVLENRIGIALGFNVGSSAKALNREINMDVCQLPGFTALHWVLPKHAEVPELYFLLMALLLGQPVREVPEKLQFDLDSVWTFIFQVPPNQAAAAPQKGAKTELIGEAAIVILAMVRTMLNQQWETEEEGSYLREYPVTLMQFLLYLYHHQPDFVPLCMGADFISAITATLFPALTMDDFKPYLGSDETMVLVGSLDRPSMSHLSTHPARKFVMDFLRMIIVDSLMRPQSSRSAVVIDLVLEATPEHAMRQQRREFQTEVLKSLMDHLLAADALLGEEAALPPSTSSNYSNVVTNIFNLTSRIVDKLWQGAYLRESKEVFDFIIKLISQAKRKSSGVSLDTIYRCLNRTILYQLSRPMRTVADQTNLLDALHKLTSHRCLVFGPGNYDQEFIGCLCYCLLQLTEDPNNISDPPLLRMTTWHVDREMDGGDQTLDCDEGGAARPQYAPSVAGGTQLLATAASRVWEELYIGKKPAIEEQFKVTLTNSDPNCSQMTTPELHAIRGLIQEPACKVWMLFYENERKCCNSYSEKLPSQIHSKLQKVGHGVLRLASRRSKRDLPTRVSPASVQDFTAWTANHVSIVKDLVEYQHQQYLQNCRHTEKYLMEEWAQTELELMRERGIWGPPVGSDLDKWMLDMTEGPHRMRKKMIHNELFYLHYPYHHEKDSEKQKKSKNALSRHSRRYFERYRSHSLVSDEAMPQGVSADHTQDALQDTTAQNDDVFVEQKAVEMPTPSMLPRLLPGKPSHLDNDPDDDQEGENAVATEGSTEPDIDVPSEGKTDNQMLLKLLEEGEKITHMFRCARIEGLDTVEGLEGLLLFGKEHFYVVDGFVLLRSMEIVDIDTLPPDLHDPIIPSTTKTTPGPQKRKCLKFVYEEIREVHKRRYLLQPIAIEVFSVDGRNFLLAFPKKVRNKVHARFLAVATAITDSALESVSGQKQNAKVEPGTSLISNLIGEKSVTDRWVRGEISNFEYLMCLNTLAGRCYNDLMQYLVFPWILADYESEELDLKNPATFRDLSKPMGAQTPNRLSQYRKRFTDWEDPQGETPPYHYGTHYSSAMIVVSYLVRMEPFAQYFLRLQGGHFDLADRMFHSVRDAWFSASQYNMADVKELIPEFFYLPEMFNNSNHFDLGVKQSGIALGDVILPPWAKGDPREFVRAHREALECDYVSAHLNEWIDLIFGCKQQGQAAVDAVNVFHHLFYEGNVDIYSIDDPLKKNATIGFINNFGQIPKQLFKKPHPQKKLSTKYLDSLSLTPMGGSLPSAVSDRLFFHNLDNLRPTKQPVKELKGSVGQILHGDKSVVAVEQNKVLIPPAFNKYLAWGFADMSVRIGNYDSDKATSVFENLDTGEILCAACPNAKIVITAGTSTVVNVWEFGRGKDKKSLRLKQPLYGHTEAVTCVAASPAYNIIVSGSRDRTCLMWDLNQLVFVRQLRGHAAPVAATCINELTGDIATCAGTYLHVWSVNGDEIASINTATGGNQQIFCVAMSQMREWDPHNVIMTGNSDGVVRMWNLEFVQVPDEATTKLRRCDVADTGRPDNTPVVPPVPHPASQAIATERLQEFKDATLLSSKDVELGSSAESDGNPLLDRLREQLDHRAWSKENAAPSVLRSNTSFTRDTDVSDSSSVGRLSLGDDIDDTSANHGSSVDDAVDALAEMEANDTTLAKPCGLDVEGATKLAASGNSGGDGTQMPTSPGADFVMVSDSEVKAAVKAATPSGIRLGQGQMLRPGFHWQRQLVFCSKLTMHTAFERKDNKDPAAVTAIAVSRDHKSVSVGDVRGRVFSWSVTDQPGRVVADHWVQDDMGDSCQSCGIRFSFSERRHHCRNCGQLFCSKCSRFETEIRRLRILKPVRVCQACHSQLKAQSDNPSRGNKGNKTS